MIGRCMKVAEASVKSAQKMSDGAHGGSEAQKGHSPGRADGERMRRLVVPWRLPPYRSPGGGAERARRIFRAVYSLISAGRVFEHALVDERAEVAEHELELRPVAPLRRVLGVVVPVADEPSVRRRPVGVLLLFHVFCSSVGGGV